MVEFRLLGAIDLASAASGSPRSVLKQPKHIAILTYLALATPRGFHRRDKLLSLFWPDSDESRARGALNQTLYRLRQSIGEDLIATRGAEDVGLNWEKWWCDAVELRAALAAQRYAEVLNLYRGELLGGFHVNASPEFDQWLDAERAAAREDAATASLQLAAEAVASGDADLAIACLRKALAIKPFEESILQRLMDLLHRKGEGHTALTEYERFAARLAADLELEPSRQSTEVALRIRDSLTRESSDPQARLRSGKLRETAPRRNVSRWKRTAGITAVVLLPTLGAYVVRTADDASEFRMSNGVVVADFVNRTNEAHLAAAVTVALNIDLAQSTAIRVAAAPHVGAVLARMGQDTVTLLTEQLAREVAVREGLKAVLRGEVVAVGSAYLISAQLITADSGRVLLSTREKASDANDVIAAVDRLSERLRKKMGDSLRGARANKPLEAVTTGSLEALKLYSAGLRAVRYSDTGDGRTSGGLPARVRPDDRAISLFEQAIAHDSTFASAYRILGVHLYWLDDQRSRVRELLTRAYGLRHRLTERERLHTEGTYFHLVTAEYDRAIACFEQLLELDAKDVVAIQNLGFLYFRRQDFARAVEMYERDWTLRGGVPAMLYISALLGAGRVERADSLLEYFAKLDSTGGLWHAELIRIRAGRGDLAAVDTLLPRMRALAANGEPSIRYQAKRMTALWKIWRGSYREGVAMLQGPSRATSLGLELSLARFEVYVLHDSVRARKRLDAALVRIPPESLPAADRPYVFLANVYAHAGDHKRAAEFQRLSRWTPLPYTFAAAVPYRFYTVEALGAAANGDIHRAREVMAAVDREAGCTYETQWRHLNRAKMEEMAGDADSAIAALERLVAEPECKLTLSWSDLWGPVTQAHAHERLAQLYDARGDSARAALHYAHFIALWPDPDPELRPRWRSAKKRLAELVPKG
ncbi:MAG TPA: BTAD domain-containing putative transcriptional regulator [Longimicrobiales bacterium]